MRRGMMIGALSASALVTTPWLARAQTTGSYLIGVTFPLTGALVPLASDARSGLELAVNDVNAAGGVNAHPLKLDFADSQGTAEGGIDAMRKLVQVDGVRAIVTVFTNVVTAQMPLADQLQVPTLSPVESPNLVSRSLYSFAHSQTIGEEAPLLSGFWKRQGYKRIYALLGDNAWGHVIEPIVSDAVAASGAVYGMSFFDLDQTDFGGVIERARDFHPGALLISAQGSTAETAVIQQVRELGITAALFNPGNYFDTPAWRSGVGSYVQGMYFAGLNIQPSTSPRFVRDFHAKTGHDPSYVAGEAYDMVNMFAYAMRRGGYNGSAIRNQLAALRGVPSVFGGRIVMEPDHYTNTAAMAIWQAQGGRLVEAFPRRVATTSRLE